MSTDRQPRNRADIVVLAVGVAVVATVWALSCWWSFAEQTRAADSLHFRHPGVLPWMLDALAVALALVALASALGGQSAGSARLGVLLALAGSVWANTQGVSLRYGGHPEHDALVMAAIAPLSAFIALEVILGRIRRLVLWLRGEPAPAAIPALRVVRLLLAPRTSFGEWRTAVLVRTDPTKPAVSLSSTRPEDTQQDTVTGAVPGGATGPGGMAPTSPPGPGPDSGGAGTPAGLSGQTGQGSSALHDAPPARVLGAAADALADTTTDAPPPAAVLHLPGASDRPHRTASRGASATASRPRRITASAGASRSASSRASGPSPEQLRDAVRDAVQSTGVMPSARKLAKDQRCHQTKAADAISAVRAELADDGTTP